MKMNLGFKKISILLLLAQVHASYCWFTKIQPPSFIVEKDIEILKQDFDELATGHKTIQEVKVAQQIIDLIRNDSAGQKHAAQWQKVLQKIDVASLSSL